jgi:hypothetical protein
MKTKIINLKNGNIKSVKIFEEWDYDPKEIPTVGEKYLVGNSDCTDSRYENYEDNIFWSDDPDKIAEGWGGNMNNNVRRFHGWRGTTNGVASYGLGVRICISAQIIRFEKTVHEIIVFGADEAIGQE